jgi:hypothetical protein
MSKEIIWSSYAVLTLFLTIIGFFIGKSHNKSLHFALFGLFVGIIISIILWFSVGKKIAY